MKIKNMFAVLLCGIAAFGLMACGSSNGASSVAESTSVIEKAEEAITYTPYDGDGEALHTGTSGTVTWTLYDDGVLFFEPTDGKSGTFASYESRSDIPWLAYYEDIVFVQSTGKIYAGEKLDSFFDGCENLEDVSGMASWDVSNTTSLDCLFYYCQSLTEVDLSKWDTSNVTNMRYVFGFCFALETIDIENWDTSAITAKTDRYSTFYGTVALTSITLGEKWTWSASNNTCISGSLFDTKSWAKEDGDGKVYTSYELATDWTSDYAGTWVAVETEE